VKERSSGDIFISKELLLSSRTCLKNFAQDNQWQDRCRDLVRQNAMVLFSLERIIFGGINLFSSLFPLRVEGRETLQS
jgi:hypothetical protein